MNKKMLERGEGKQETDEKRLEGIHNATRTPSVAGEGRIRSKGGGGARLARYLARENSSINPEIGCKAATGALLFTHCIRRLCKGVSV